VLHCRHAFAAIFVIQRRKKLFIGHCLDFSNADSLWNHVRHVRNFYFKAIMHDEF